VGLDLLSEIEGLVTGIRFLGYGSYSFASGRRCVNQSSDFQNPLSKGFEPLNLEVLTPEY
jgi:hypothetical protein